MGYLDAVRRKKPGSSHKRESILLLGCLVFGGALGTFAKYLDHRQGSLPGVLQPLDQALDLHNFLGGLAPWLFLALFLAVCAASPWYGAANAFVFLAGMVSAYYLYSYFAAGFFPRNYAMLWMGLTALSPVLAWLCWYAKGRGPLALLLSAGIVGVFLDLAFSWGMWYLSVRSWGNVVLLACTVALLRRRGKEMAGLLALGVVLAVLLDALLPVSLG